jgi:hypothetical protein
MSLRRFEMNVRPYVEFPREIQFWNFRQGSSFMGTSHGNSHDPINFILDPIIYLLKNMRKDARVITIQ